MHALQCLEIYKWNIRKVLHGWKSEIAGITSNTRTNIKFRTSQSKHFLANTITCQHSKYKGKFIIVLYHYYHYRMQITNFFKFISWETLMNKSINVPDSIPASNDKLSLHYKLYSFNTTNEFKRLQFPVLFAFEMTINKEHS